MTARVSGGDGLSITEHLLYLIVDELRLSNWQRSKDGSKNRNRPNRISPLASKTGRRYGRTDRSREEVEAVLARYGPRTA